MVARCNWLPSRRSSGGREHQWLLLCPRRPEDDLPVLQKMLGSSLHVGHLATWHCNQLGLGLTRHLLLVPGHRLPVAGLHHRRLTWLPGHGDLHAAWHSRWCQHQVDRGHLGLTWWHRKLPSAGDHILLLLLLLRLPWHWFPLLARSAADHVLLTLLRWKLGCKDHLTLLAALTWLQELCGRLENQLALRVEGGHLRVGCVLAGSRVEAWLDHLELWLAHCLWHHHLLLWLPVLHWRSTPMHGLLPLWLTGQLALHLALLHGGRGQGWELTLPCHRHGHLHLGAAPSTLVLLHAQLGRALTLTFLLGHPAAVSSVFPLTNPPPPRLLLLLSSPQPAIPTSSAVLRSPTADLRLALPAMSTVRRLSYLLCCSVFCVFNVMS